MRLLARDYAHELAELREKLTHAERFIAKLDGELADYRRWWQVEKSGLQYICRLPGGPAAGQVGAMAAHGPFVAFPFTVNGPASSAEAAWADSEMDHRIEARDAEDCACAGMEDPARELAELRAQRDSLRSALTNCAQSLSLSLLPDVEGAERQFCLDCARAALARCEKGRS